MSRNRCNLRQLLLICPLIIWIPSRALANFVEFNPNLEMEDGAIISIFETRLIVRHGPLHNEDEVFPTPYPQSGNWQAVSGNLQGTLSTQFDEFQDGLSISNQLELLLKNVSGLNWGNVDGRVFAQTYFSPNQTLSYEVDANFDLAGEFSPQNVDWGMVLWEWQDSMPMLELVALAPPGTALPATASGVLQANRIYGFATWIAVNGNFDISDSEAENLFALKGSSSLELRTVPSPNTLWLVAPALLLIWRRAKRRRLSQV